MFPVMMNTLLIFMITSLTTFFTTSSHFYLAEVKGRVTGSACLVPRVLIFSEPFWGSWGLLFNSLRWSGRRWSQFVRWLVICHDQIASPTTPTPRNTFQQMSSDSNQGLASFHGNLSLLYPELGKVGDCAFLVKKNIFKNYVLQKISGKKYWNGILC